MPIHLPDLSDSEVRNIVAEIDLHGYYVMRDCIDENEMAAIRRVVHDAMARSHGEYVGFSGAQGVEGTALEVMAESPTFKTLMQRLYGISTGRPPPDANFYQVLRCLTGKSSGVHSLYFHFDSYVVTALLPVLMPIEGRTGDLIVLPNVRKIRTHYLFNLADKVLLDNRLAQFSLRAAFERNWIKYTRVRLKPGNIYFFWGYRSIHTNEACDPDNIRATALFHYANPHHQSSLYSLLRKRAS
jgi:hypothetical protein